MGANKTESGLQPWWWPQETIKTASLRWGFRGQLKVGMGQCCCFYDRGGIFTLSTISIPDHPTTAFFEEVLPVILAYANIPVKSTYGAHRCNKSCLWFNLLQFHMLSVILVLQFWSLPITVCPGAVVKIWWISLLSKSFHLLPSQF